MKILHYNLGTPPYRSGGLTAWSMDLIYAQIQEGHEVTLMYPGEIRVLDRSIRIKESKNLESLSVYRIVNPLPVPLTYSVGSIGEYLDYDKGVDFKSFFQENDFDVVHIHTLMGLPVEFLQQAKSIGLKLVYTAHDVFGVWPEPRSDDADSIFNAGYIGNQPTLSYRDMIVMQSRVYRLLKVKGLIRPLKNIAKKVLRKRSNQATKSSSSDLRNREIYDKLREYYVPYFRLFDAIHYNSAFIQEIFRQYGIDTPSKVIPVYHSHLPEKPVGMPERSSKKGSVSFLYSGPQDQAKGYHLLLEVLDDIWATGQKNFSLIVHGTSSADRSYIQVRPPYVISDLKSVYEDVDVTIVPSLCYETFGMVVAESLSFNVPVVVSRNVGAKELLDSGRYGYEFKSREGLVDAICQALVSDKSFYDKKRAIARSKNLKFNNLQSYRHVMGLYERRI